MSVIAITAIGSWAFLGPLRGTVPLWFGKNPLIHVMIVFGVSLYLLLSLTSPTMARKSIRDSFSTLKKLFPFILAALFIAGAAVTLVPKEILAGYLGEQAGPIAVLLGVGIGSVLPACPFVSYPLIAGLWAAGAGFPGIMGMLFGAGLAFPCYLSCDLTYFDHRIMALRIALTYLAALVAGFLVYFLLG